MNGKKSAQQHSTDSITKWLICKGFFMINEHETFSLHSSIQRNTMQSCRREDIYFGIVLEVRAMQAFLLCAVDRVVSFFFVAYPHQQQQQEQQRMHIFAISWLLSSLLRHQLLHTISIRQANYQKSVTDSRMKISSLRTFAFSVTQYL